jgi:uncharacterized protein
MFERLPDWVDPARLAARAREIDGTLPLSDMPRLALVLADTAGEAEGRFAFDRVQGRPDRVRGHVAAILHLQCQRCLEAMDWQVDQAFEVSLVAEEAELAGVPEGEDAVWVEARGLSLHTLLEDELLLSLPIVALHPEGTACAAGARREFGQSEVVQARREGKDNPFAALESLKRDEDDNH